METIMALPIRDNLEDLPQLPDKRYFNISEVSELCQVKSHVLRYWEQEFPQLQYVARRNNRRVYKKEDLILIRKIRFLLHEQGFTIAGARQQISQDYDQKSTDFDDLTLIKVDLEDIIKELEIIREVLL